ncbi:MAG: hypothetical protein ABI406_01130 [Ktedonobacteraceae bacterium]
MKSCWFSLESNRRVVLHRREDREAVSRLVPHQLGVHPNEGVLRQLTAFLGEMFEPQKSIVHSTSWRYNSQGERLILTYLVVLPQGSWAKRRAATGCILLQGLGDMEQARGDHLRPPERIEVAHVFDHALDHLAWLSRCDASIRAILSTEWLEVLRSRCPMPAGYLPLYSTIP